MSLIIITNFKVSQLGEQGRKNGKGGEQWKGTKKLFQREACTETIAQRKDEKGLHRDAVTQRSFYTEAFSHRQMTIMIRCKR